MSKNTVHVHVNADGAFPELARRDQVRGLLTGIGGVRRLNGPPAALLVGRTRHGRPIALEVNLSTLAVAVDALRRAHGIELNEDVDLEEASICPGCRNGWELDERGWHVIPEGVRTIPFQCEEAS